MRDRFHSLPLYSLVPGAGFVRPRQQLPDSVTPDTPAVFVMTDLRQVPAVSVSPRATINAALDRMRHKNVRMLFVADEDDTLLGLVTTTDIQGEKAIRYLEQNGSSRDDILVSHLMTPQQRLEVLDLDEVLRARVGDIVATLKTAGRQHALVVEGLIAGQPIVRGIFSATQIGRLLKEPFETIGAARSFAELELALHA
jgi:CBS domain containing-hemolysin-like protein